jgi:hypothetical protein
MATANSNNYVQGASYVTQESLTRTNPYAADGSDAQAMELYGMSVYGTRHSIAFTWAVSSAGKRVTFTPSTGATTATDYIKFYVTDGQGNEAYSTGFQSSAATAALAVTTSALDPREEWMVTYQTSNNDGASKMEFLFRIGEWQIAANSSATVSYSF